MNRKSWKKLSVILPIVCGIITGAVLFILGAADDAPGLCLAGVVIAFLLSLWGVCNAGTIKWRQLWYILPLCFGGGALVMSVALKLDGEFEEMPALFFGGLALGVVLVAMGIVSLIKARNKRDSKDTWVMSQRS